VFVFGAVLPLALVPVLIWALPESILMLTDRGNRAVPAILRRLDPGAAIPANATFINSEPKEKGFPVALLFREGRAPVTVLLWIMCFVNLRALVFMNSWLPTILNNAGLSAYGAIIIGSVSHFGGIAGGSVIAPLCDKLNRYVVLACVFVLSALSIAAIGLAGDHAGWATAAVFFAGFFTFGGQNAANAIAATSYPTVMRATGTGWALGIGRTGQIVGPYIGGWLLSMQWASNDIMYVVAIPGLIAATAALAINVVSRRGASQLAPAAS
jgi:AAHS family 4-hydroxybenzoate transporter-like MFS transporter